MKFKLHVEVRQVDVAKALENLTYSVDGCPVHHAILRAIGHSVPMTVHYTGIRIKLLGGQACGYDYQQWYVYNHISTWIQICARNPRWNMEPDILRSLLYMPDFDFDLPLNEAAWEALGLREPCAQCGQFQREQGSKLCVMCIPEEITGKESIGRAGQMQQAI